MNKEKIRVFANNNAVVLVFIPMLIGIHWGWVKLQDNPSLVNPNYKKEPFKFMKYMKQKITGEHDTESTE